MHPQVKRAFELNVDADTIQAHAAKEDWDGLEAACEVKVRRVNEELASSLKLRPGVPSVELLTENTVLRKALEQANVTIQDYDRQMALMTAELEKQRELLGATIEEN